MAEPLPIAAGFKKWKMHIQTISFRNAARAITKIIKIQLSQSFTGVLVRGRPRSALLTNYFFLFLSNPIDMDQFFLIKCSIMRHNTRRWRTCIPRWIRFKTFLYLQHWAATFEITFITRFFLCANVQHSSNIMWQPSHQPQSPQSNGDGEEAVNGPMFPASYAKKLC